MKKLIALALAAVLLLALAACGNTGAEKKNEEAGESEPFAGMANPWSEAADAAAAAEGAGVGYFEVPEENMKTDGGQVNWYVFRYMKGIAQANGAIGTAELMVRKGLKQDGEDISGDYTDYKYSWTQELDGLTVNCSGNEKDRTMRAMWTTDNFSYCFIVRGQGDLRDTYGLDAATTAQLVAEIQ